MKGGVFALGNFDGVHRGHQLVIEAAVKQAKARSMPVRVLTFEPHPRAIFKPDAEPFRLTPFPVKERLLKSLGVDDVIALPFTKEFSELSAHDFVEKVLLQECAVDHVVAGHDFMFGHGRQGDMKLLTTQLATHNIGVSEIAPLTGAGGAFSSTRIRDILRQGDVRGASDMLGRLWSLEGIILKGAQRGHTIGVPTANTTLGEYLRPKFGVYVIKAGRAGEELNYSGVANIGVRPTVDGKSENLEAYIFDFDQDIYGQKWEFALTRFIRPELKFESFDALKTQIYKDIEEAKRI